MEKVTMSTRMEIEKMIGVLQKAVEITSSLPDRSVEFK